MSQINYTIMSSPDELTTDEACIIYKDCNDGFLHNLQDLTFKSSDLNDFIEKLSKETSAFKKYDYSYSKNYVNMRFINDDIRAYARGNSIDLCISFVTKTEELSHLIWTIFKKYQQVTSSVDIYITSYFMSGGRLTDSQKQMKTKELAYLTDKYYPYLNVGLMFDQFFTGSENIFLIVGEPGLGKSKMSTLAIKHAFENTDKLPYDKMNENPGVEEQYISVINVKSVDVLTNDTFWRKLENDMIDLVIIDDLDYMLTKREGEVLSADDSKKNAFLNQFLSFTDGIEKTNTKFIITTNQDYEDIDAALLRKGRLFDIIELRRLTQEEALCVWVENELDEDDFHSVFGSNYILPAELGSEISKRLNKRIEQTTTSYLNEEGISKIKKASRTKRINL